MNKRIFSKFIFRTAAAATALWLAGCATSPAAMTPEDTVRQRAGQRTQAMLKGDFPAIYELTAPSYRKLHSLQSFKARFGAGVTWTQADVKNVSCEQQRCTVDLGVTVKSLIPGKFGDTMTLQFQEVWLPEDGNWWLYQGL